MNEGKDINLKQETKLKEVFITFLKEILYFKNTDNIETFKAKYNYQHVSSNIPYLEGSEKYIFASLINSAFDTFITKVDFPKSKKDGIPNESKLISNILYEDIKLHQISPINIISNEN